MPKKTVSKMEFAKDLPLIDILAFITDNLQQSYSNSNGKTQKIKVLTEFFERWESDSSIETLKTFNFEFESGMLST